MRRVSLSEEKNQQGQNSDDIGDILADIETAIPSASD
jgi:hypothetical protein